LYPRYLYPGSTLPDASRTKISVKNAIPSIDWENPLSWIKTGLSLIKWSPDVIIFPWWMWGWALPYWVIAKIVTRRNIKILFICHNIIEHEASWWKSILARFVLSVGDFYIVHSQTDYENLKSIFPHARVVLSYHPTYEIFCQRSLTKEDARIKLKIDSKFKRILLFFGIIRPYKGIEYLTEAIPKILSELPDLCLIIAGESWNRNGNLLKQIKDLHIENAVRLDDKYILNEEVGAYFAAADIVIMPYISGTGSGIAQIAYGCNKPVIATNVGCLSEVIQDKRTGYVVEPRNPQAIADAVVSFYKNSMEAVFVRNIAREREKFSWDRMVKIIEVFFEQRDGNKIFG
jgi:glycosyltransferase involved in cell wall biosynthesis